MKNKQEKLLEAIRENKAVVVNSLAQKLDLNVMFENEQEKLHDTYLNFAVRNSTKEIVEILLKYGADINGQSFDGNTALHNALILAENKFTRVDMLDFLLSQGANANIKNYDGKTPLAMAFIIACRENVSEAEIGRVADTLIKSGAKIDASIITYASKYSEEFVEALVEEKNKQQENEEEK